MDPLTEEEERKRLLLERFQAEVGCVIGDAGCPIATIVSRWLVLSFSAFVLRNARTTKRSGIPAIYRGLSGMPHASVCDGTQHPGFDFSGAEFNGAAPDARSFMGGMPSGI